MKTTVKTFWICMLLMLTCSISGKAIDLVQVDDRMAGTAEVSASLSSCSSTSDNSIDKKNSLFTNTKFAWTTDVELGNKPVSETYSSHQQRLRRVIEDNLFLRNILLMLSNHENLLVQGRSKLYYSDKDPYYALTGSDYYIYTLRRILILICFIIAVLIFHFVLGNPSNFMNNDPNNHPLPGNFLGTIYKGGFIVPVIQTLLLTVIALSIERYIAIGAAFGKGSLVKFVANIKAALAEGDMKKAQQICDSQRGSVANVVNATLKKYAEMENDTELSKDQKLLAIQKELEEATALELPMMEQNLPIIGTITTLGTLMGLLGTVIGMIRSFAALAAGGSADSMALSQGISEALINTAFGILTGALAVISYNYYTNKIDKLTYSLDEVGFSIVQTFAATHK